MADDDVDEGEPIIEADLMVRFVVLGGGEDVRNLGDGEKCWLSGGVRGGGCSLNKFVPTSGPEAFLPSWPCANFLLTVTMVHRDRIVEPPGLNNLQQLAES